jgi:hypothetical protein
MLDVVQFRGRVAKRIQPWRDRAAGRWQALQPYLLRLQIFRHRRAHWLLLIALVPAVRLFYFLGPALWSRLTYQLEIGWDEGGGLVHAYRILHGQPLYTPPDVGFMPFPYPPGHPLVIALLGSVFGINYTVGRLVSLLGIIGAAVLLGREVYKSWQWTRWPWIWSVLAVGLVAVGYPIAGGYYDLIRVDSLALFFSVASCVAVLALEQEARPRRYLVCIFLFLAAAATKQTSAAYIAWLLLFLFTKKPGRALLLGLGFALAVALSVGFLEWRSGGNFLRYVFSSLQKHEVQKGRAEAGFEIIRNFAPYIVLIPIAMLLGAWKDKLSRRALAWIGMLAAAVPVGLLPYAKLGGYINNFIGIVVLVGPVALVLAGSLLAKATQRRRALPVEALVLAAVVALYTHERMFPMRPYTITSAQREGAAQLFKWLAGFGPRTLMPQYPFHAIAIGTEIEQTHPMPWVDAWWAGRDVNAFARHAKKVGADHMVITGGEAGFMIDYAARDYTLEAVRPEGYPGVVMDNIALPQFMLKPRRKRNSPRCVFDFERGKFEGWSGAVGTFKAPQRREGSTYIGAEGRFFLNTYTGGGDPATGTLTSPSFTLDKPKLSLLVGGGNSEGLRVELLIDGAAVRLARGLRADLLADVVWDVSEFQGKSAQIRVVDQERGSWAHIELDSVCLED